MKYKFPFKFYLIALTTMGIGMLLQAYTENFVGGDRFLKAYASNRDAISRANIGDTVTFGHYEQDNNTENGAEPIEWKVLAQQSGALLLISQKALDCQMYQNDPNDRTVWHSSDLRKWLNTQFAEKAFTPKELKRIAPRVIAVTKSNTPAQSSAGGRMSQEKIEELAQDPESDKVFVLSIPEMDMYMRGAENRKCEPSAYAVSRGAELFGKTKNCLWWLCSHIHRTAFAVNGDGEICRVYARDKQDTISVRPSLWVSE